MATRCFVRDACLITPDATAIRGRDDIRSILAQLVASHSQIEIQASSVLVAGDMALGSEDWRIRSRSLEGKHFEQVSRAAIVLRRFDAGWKFAIAAPWGWG